MLEVRDRMAMIMRVRLIVVIDKNESVFVNLDASFRQKIKNVAENRLFVKNTFNQARTSLNLDENGSRGHCNSSFGPEWPSIGKASRRRKKGKPGVKLVSASEVIRTVRTPPSIRIGVKVTFFYIVHCIGV